jgi:hypothetical protein
VVTVATFTGPVTYVLHDGSEDPGAAVGRVKAGPAVVGAERKRLLAAFNGGFKLSAGGGEYVARSALGQDASGDLIYAASMSTTPADLAFVLAYAGAQTAMELDINPEWVQLDAASRPGGALRASIPGQNRPADQYLLGWARDFITVLGPPPG